MKPYVLCVPQFIKMNAAYPIVLIIAPSESLELYGMPFEGVRQFVKTTGFNPGFNFPVLSDAGLALSAFCLRHKLPQFQCHRYLIEWLGNCSIMRVMLLKIPRYPSFEAFQNSLRLSNDVFAELKRAGRLTNSVIAKYLDFTG